MSVLCSTAERRLCIAQQHASEANFSNPHLAAHTHQAVAENIALLSPRAIMMECTNNLCQTMPSIQHIAVPSWVSNVSCCTCTAAQECVTGSNGVGQKNAPYVPLNTYPPYMLSIWPLHVQQQQNTYDIIVQAASSCASTEAGSSSTIANIFLAVVQQFAAVTGHRLQMLLLCKEV